MNRARPAAEGGLAPRLLMAAASGGLPAGLSARLLMAAALVMGGLGPGGCGTGRQAEVSGSDTMVEASSRRPPQWITRIPESRDHLYFVGVSGDENAFDRARKAAVGDALRQVLETIGVRVTVSTAIQEEYARELRVELESRLLASGEARVQGAVLEEVYHQKHRRRDGSLFYRVWVLLRYRKEALAREQERLAELAALELEEARSLAARAQALLEEGRVWEALAGYLDAAFAALKVEDGEVYVDRFLIRAGRMLAEIRMEQAGGPPTGMLGGPLQEPLALRVYREQDGRRLPVAGAPVTFTYRVPGTGPAGYRLRTMRAVTGAGGIAEAPVERIEQVGEVWVTASLDLDAEVSRLREAAGRAGRSVEVFRDIARARTARLLFVADTPARYIPTAVYLVQRGPEGEIVPGMTAAAAAHRVLADKGFRVTLPAAAPADLQGMSEGEAAARLAAGAGGEVHRVVYGTVRILSRDRVSGFRTARARAQVSLVELDGDRAEGSWKVSGGWEVARSGTGKTPEEAVLSAFIQAGSSLGELLSRTLP
ncbi:MAG: hypothetical protein ACOC8N_03235 [Spirochaetota bacterium]